MASAASFVEPSNWEGGWYELAVKLGPTSDRRLLDTARWVWSRLDLKGPYQFRNLEPGDQDRVELTLESLDNLYGVARVRGWVPMVCGSGAVREEAGADWFYLFLPMGALAAADRRVGWHVFEVRDQDAEWTASLDDWFAGIALALREIVPFEIALIGQEASGTDEDHARALAEGRPTGAYVDSGGYHRSQLYS